MIRVGLMALALGATLPALGATLVSTANAQSDPVQRGSIRS